ncbi:cobyrinate a,c-diamide synthase [Angustibacter sp. McL0619]|uniref:cobyrinate a,c-diamide synthase n=1 Tax=Angustibacter sp. McL0619 TaxID=3415676 RepID=UPI003CF21336
MFQVPRLVIAAPGSGHGKTTVATGLMAALRDRGLEVSGHKIGPDYIDPGYHALATGRPPRNLDPVLQGEHRVAPLFLHGALTPRPADVAVVEGVMGLFDGAIGTGGMASTAHVARLLDAPVVLVVDVSGASRSVAATVLGFAGYDPRVRIAGVILNRVASQRHEDEIREALQPTGVAVLGSLGRDEGLATPSRHLGLVPAVERADEAQAAVRLLGARVAAGTDLDAVLRVARSAAPLSATAWNPADEVSASPGPAPLVASAGGSAFSFRYTETDELLAAAGAQVVDVDPLRDQALPAQTSALYLGGGFPEVYVEELSANVLLRADVFQRIGSGLPVVAECAGLLYLCRELDGLPLVGAVDATAEMTGRLTLGYRQATASQDSLLTATGESVTGHEFHRTQVLPGHGSPPAWQFRDTGYGGRTEGFASARLHASFLHVHWAGHPQAAQRFVAAAAKHAEPVRG